MRHAHGRLVIAAALCCVVMGCAVGQPPGNGQVLHQQEPASGGWYWLYLPEGYDQEVEQGRRLPLVMTFHGMKPFDNANSQIREWQQEADRYGYVVCAPELLSPDLASPLPLNSVTGSLKRDEEFILAVMDALAQTTNVDPNLVLSTSWSYGGYVAHYMANRHPDRFSCIAVKQSNFSERILDARAVPRYRDRKVGIFYTENDFKLCRTESEAAARWYSRHGFDLTFAVFQDLGHERRPSMAASFFAQTCGATPKTPPVELARLQVKELPAPAALASAPATKPRPQPQRQARPQPVPARSSRAPAPRPQDRAVASATPTSTSRQRFSPARTPVKPAPRVTPAPPSEPVSYTEPPARARALRTRPVAPPPPVEQGTPPRSTPTELPAPDRERSPLVVRLSSTIGLSPLLVSYSVSGPAGLLNGAFFLWTDNGEPISNGINGQKFLTEPGTHRIDVLVTTADGREYRAGQTVTVLERVGRRAAAR